MDVDPGGNPILALFLLLLALAGCSVLPATSSPVGVGPQAPVAAEASVAP